MTIADRILDRIDGLLDMPRSPIWDGIRVADMSAERFDFMDDLRIEDWPHRIYWRQFDPVRGEHMECMREISVKQARALGARRFPPGRLVERCWQSIKDPAISYRAPLVLRGQNALSLAISVAEARRNEDKGAAYIINLMLMERYQWSVRFRATPQALAVSLDTDPAGAREAFKLRDIPDGRTRRAALRNWVSEHSRKRRGGSDRELVRAHLRGETKFNWNGLECELVPSQFDREKEIERKAEGAK